VTWREKSRISWGQECDALLNHAVSWQDLRRGNLLSLGEGYSGLLPYLIKNHVRRARGVDLSYAFVDQGVPVGTWNDKFLAEYVARWGKNLVRGNAMDLREIAPDCSQHFVLSHLLNPLSLRLFEKMMTEIVRILTEGGQARVATHLPHRAMYRRMLAQFKDLPVDFAIVRAESRIESVVDRDWFPTVHYHSRI
jgi:hypothetical protein